MQLTHHGWLAGVIDAEGCLTIFRRTVRTTRGQTIAASANLTITNSSDALLRACRRQLDALGVKYTYISPRNSTTRPIRRISVRNYGSLLSLLDAIEPHLIAKREQAALMREFVIRAAARQGFRATDERLGYCQRMSDLNRNGQLIAP